MKIIFALFFIFSISQVKAFTLVTASGVKFATDEITVNVAADSCSTLGISTNTLLDWVEEVSNTFWNSVSTSAIVLKRGSILSTSISSATSLSGAISLTEIGTILVGCSTNTTLFGASDTSIGGVGGISSSSAGVRGAVLLNGNGSFSSLEQSQQKATLAHEFGHAIGLGHSEDEAALMYFSSGGGKLQEHLTLDDKDGVTYLYPHDSLPGSCGSIAFISRNNKKGPSIMSLLFFILMLIAFNFGKIKNRLTSFS